MAAVTADLYQLIGVSSTASSREIEKAFRQRALAVHPDKNPERNRECEELMKQLSRAKQVLLDSEQREKYDDSYTGDPRDENTVRQFLGSGKRHSEAYVRIFEQFKQDYDGFAFIDNYKDVKEKLEKLERDLRNVSERIPPYQVNSNGADRYTDYLKEYGHVDNIKAEVKKRIPSTVWNLSDVHPEERGMFIRAYRSVFGCDYLERGNGLFSRRMYIEALYSYMKASDGRALYNKCQILLKANNEACPLYASALMKINGYSRRALDVLIAWLAKNSEEESDLLLLTACGLDNDLKGIELHEKILKYFIKNEMPRDLIFSTCLYLQKNDKKSAAALQAIDQLNEKYLAEDKKKVVEFLYSGSIKDMVLYILEHRCNKAVAVTYEEMTKNQNIESFPAKYRASLYLLQATFLKLEGNFTKCIDLCRDALFSCFADDIRGAICVLMGDCTMINSFNVMLTEKQEIQIPTEHSFDGFLKSNSGLRSTLRYEKSVLSQELSNFDKAMLYIDLSMSAIGISVFANNYLIAAQFLLQEMMLDEADASTRYALRHLICLLIANVIHISRSYCNPMTAVYFYDKSLHLMSAAHRRLGQSLELHSSKPKTTILINEMHETLLEIVCNELTRLAKVTPLMVKNLQLSTDLLFLDIIGDELLEQFYTNQLNEEVANHPLTNLYKYQLLELNWQGSGEDQSFNLLREKLMDAELKEMGWNSGNVEKLLSWPMINRDSNGFIDRQQPWLNTTNGTIISVEGVCINFKTGQFEPIFILSPPGHSGLVCFDDVLEIFRKGIGSSFFTLDQSRLDMQYHCCQEMKYIPSGLKGSNFLATLLHADYLLKMFTLGNEVSAKKPFAFQSTSDNLLDGLPEHLRHVLMPLQERRNGKSNGQVHRFWIEPCEMEYFTVEESEDTKTFRFFDVQMKVKKHLMKYNRNGELVDDEDDDEDDDNENDGEENTEHTGGNDDSDRKKKKEPSPEKQFAKEFTKHYNEISEHFQVFARLKELLKLAAIAEILKSTVKSLKKVKLELKVDTEPVIPILTELRGKFQEHYPCNTSRNRNKYYNELLRENGIYDESRVDPSSITQAKRNIENQLEKADEDTIKAIEENLSKSFGIENFVGRNYHRAVLDWMDSSSRATSNNLAAVVATAIKDKLTEKLSRFESNLKSLGFDGLLKDENDDRVTWNEKSRDSCVYIPAAYKRLDNIRVYGGVNMSTRLKEVSINKTSGDALHGNNKLKQGSFHVYKLVATQRSFKKASLEMRQMYGKQSYIGISHDRNIYLTRKHNEHELSKRGYQTARRLTKETGITYIPIVIMSGLKSNLHARCEEALLISRGQKATGAGSGYFASANKHVPDLRSLLREAEEHGTDIVPAETVERMRQRVEELPPPTVMDRSTSKPVSRNGITQSVC